MDGTGIRIDGRTKVTGVTGWPVGHSRSPLIHNYWMQKYRINGVYVPFPIAPDDFMAAIGSLRAAGIAGLNVTLPHKQAAFALCDTRDDPATEIRAVNTLILKDNTVHGLNTDAPGFLASLQHAVPDWTATGCEAVVLGAGGAARAIVWSLLQAGVPRIGIVNRSADRAQTLVNDFGSRVSIRADTSDLSSCALLVNTTSLGMTGQPPLAIDLETLPVQAVVSDIVYEPLQTPLLAEASRRGNRTVDGLGMLLHQAAAGFHAWYGVMPAIDGALRDHVLKA